MFTEVLPLGALGDLPSFSILSGDAIQMDLNVSAAVFPKTSDFGGFMVFVSQRLLRFWLPSGKCSQEGSDDSSPATSLGSSRLLGLCLMFCLLILHGGGMSKSGLMLLN